MILQINETLKDSTVTTNSLDINYLLSNIFDSRLSRIYRTFESTTCEIVFDAGTDVQISAINIANHNISSLVTTLVLEGNATDVWTSPSFSETLTWNENIINGIFALSTAYRYWRVVVIDATNTDGYIQMGRVWIGQAYEAPSIGTTVAHQIESHSVKTITPSGQSYQDTRYQNSTVSIEWPIISHVEKAELIDLFIVADIGNPWFITFEEECLDLDTMYVTNAGGILNFQSTISKDYYGSSLSVIEEV